ncbi:hypothetical protein PR202_ga29721 [Eleusine coracana subsp. coracana]|uniref:Uncharacterized protein n=1 Tax=Eleusine coracana subsp. coracana TaxID=191504 RepID=A0AAV5DLW9_ELECO|nr:hypothetical protein PR202_ga29721 [Eleusine coracana subsp. coracana]
MATHRTLLSFTVLLGAVLVAPPPAAAQPPWQYCGDSGDSFPQNSTYQSNLGLLSTALAQNAPSSPSLFAAGKVGAPPDMVYALTLCRGDTNASACGDCVATAFRDAQQLCAYIKAVTIYYDLCYLRFSNRNFLAGDDNDELHFPKRDNVTAPFEVFDAAVAALLNATADRAAADATKRFATGEVVAGRGSVVPAIYALAQCTPDMAQESCRRCLASVIGKVPEYYSGSPSGRFIGVRCNYQYELSQFFSGEPLLQLPAPAVPPAVANPPVQVPENSSPPAPPPPASRNRADPSRTDALDWNQKYNIILGIAKGILYLHEDSSIRIVHRDLKANNILLDENMNPKIADFGLARLLGGDHTETKTTSVAGTYGYMAPEYALSGNVSPKIDVFSYGILVLEIITGKKNSSYDESNKAVNLLTDVWNCWTKGKALQLVNHSALDENSRRNVLRGIHIGLLCVQEHPDDRPSISSVVVMLTRSRVKLQQPQQPAFFFGEDSSSVLEQHVNRNCIYEGSDVIVEDNFSVNDVTNTDPYPRVVLNTKKADVDALNHLVTGIAAQG